MGKRYLAQTLAIILSIACLEVERMAGHSADQAVAYLSEFFAKQGWIRPDQEKKARID